MTTKKSQIALVFFLFIFYTNSFGQKLIPYHVSEDVSINIPQEFSITDTLGQNLIKAFIEDEIILIMKPEKKVDAYIEDKDELLKFYEGYYDGMLDRSKGQTISKEFVQINGMFFLKSSFKTKISGANKIWNNYILLLNKTPYSFLMISTPENNKVEFFENEIVQSIKFRKDLTSKNQMNTNEEDSQAYKIGELVGKFFMYALIGGIIVYCISRKKNKDS